MDRGRIYIVNAAAAHERSERNDDDPHSIDLDAENDKLPRPDMPYKSLSVDPHAPLSPAIQAELAKGMFASRSGKAATSNDLLSPPGPVTVVVDQRSSRSDSTDNFVMAAEDSKKAGEVVVLDSPAAAKTPVQNANSPGRRQRSSSPKQAVGVGGKMRRRIRQTDGGDSDDDEKKGDGDDEGDVHLPASNIAARKSKLRGPINRLIQHQWNRDLSIVMNTDFGTEVPEVENRERTARLMTLGGWLNLFFSVALILSIVSFCLGTMSSFYTKRVWNEILFYVDATTIAIFTIEYILRVIIVERWTHVFHWLFIIDLLSIVPFYFEVGFAAREAASSGGVKDVIDAMSDTDGVSALRALRLARAFRVLKLVGKSGKLTMLVGAIKESLDGLSVLVLSLAVLVVFFASLVFYAEQTVMVYDKQQNLWLYGTGEASDYQSIPDTFYWATATLIGDPPEVPRSPWAKLLAVCTMLASILCLAFPLTIISESYSKAVNAFAKEAKRKREEQARRRAERKKAAKSLSLPFSKSATMSATASTLEAEKPEYPEKVAPADSPESTAFVDAREPTTIDAMYRETVPLFPAGAPASMDLRVVDWRVAGEDADAETLDEEAERRGRRKGGKGRKDRLEMRIEVKDAEHFRRILRALAEVSDA
ncbi:hypothetical protein HDU96_004860 [Phlyctochytrium bullatum]|nr:hypothetical protein HDU96_004860 [Phlyctochytrium bullatum]